MTGERCLFSSHWSSTHASSLLLGRVPVVSFLGCVYDGRLSRRQSHKHASFAQHFFHVIRLRWFVGERILREL